MSEKQACWICCDVACQAQLPETTRLGGLLKSAGLAICNECFPMVIYGKRRIPGMHEYARWHLRMKEFEDRVAYPTAWIFELASPDAVNGEMLYRLGAPSEHIDRCVSIPGWIFVVTYE